MDDFVSGYYVSVTAEDKAGVLGRIATLFGDGGVSIKSAIQREAEHGSATILFLTHNAGERSFMRALDTVKALPSVRGIDSVIRVF